MQGRAYCDSGFIRLLFSGAWPVASRESKPPPTGFSSLLVSVMQGTVRFSLSPHTPPRHPQSWKKDQPEFFPHPFYLSFHFNPHAFSDSSRLQITSFFCNLSSFCSLCYSTNSSLCCHSCDQRWHQEVRLCPACLCKVHRVSFPGHESCAVDGGVLRALF